MDLRALTLSETNQKSMISLLCGIQKINEQQNRFLNAKDKGDCPRGGGWGIGKRDEGDPELQTSCHKSEMRSTAGGVLTTWTPSLASDSVSCLYSRRDLPQGSMLHAPWRRGVLARICSLILTDRPLSKAQKPPLQGTSTDLWCTAGTAWDNYPWPDHHAPHTIQAAD